MTWEEIIIQIRKDPAYKKLVELAYFEEDLSLNVERFRTSDEFLETLKQIKSIAPKSGSLKLLDLGAGNGVASLAFALEGFDVTAVEPDKSETIGSGAIRKLEVLYKTGRVNIIESFAEDLPMENNYFDIVYIRQAVHHAHRLGDFIKQTARVLKKDGILFSVRDHVIYDEKDKQWFLENHPLHKFYGGENAFTLEQYKSSMIEAGLQIKKIFRHYDTVINYFPESKEEIFKRLDKRESLIQAGLSKKLPFFIARLPRIRKMYASSLEKKLGKALDESKIPGRLISFLAIKK